MAVLPFEPVAVPVPTIDIAFILTKSFDKQQRRLRKTWRKSRSKWTENRPHDLRVAVRKITSLLELLECVVDADRLEPSRKLLKKFLGRLSPVRDLQIELGYIQRSLVTFPQLTDFHRLLRKRESTAIDKFKKSFRKQTFRDIDSELAIVRELLRRALENAASQEELRQAVLSTVEREFEHLVVLKQRCNGVQLAKMHRLRVAFKKFRYAIAALRPVFKDVTKDEMRALQTFQSALGDVQDLEVIEADLRDWTGRQKRRVRKAIAPVFREISATRRTCIDNAFRCLEEVHALWQSIQGRNVTLRPVPNPS